MNNLDNPDVRAHEEEQVIGQNVSGHIGDVNLEDSDESPVEDGPDEDESSALLDEGPDTHLEKETVNQVSSMGIVGNSLLCILH